MKTHKMLTLGFGAAAVASVLGGGSLLAQGSGAASSLADGVTSVVHQMTPGGKEDHKAEQDAYIQSLATRLNIPVGTLTQALKDTSVEKLNQLVSDGKLTQAQADAIRAEIESGNKLFFGAGGGMKGKGEHAEGDHDEDGEHGRGGPGGMMDQAALATFLRIDEDTLHSELESGKTLAAVATAHGKSRDQLKAFLTEQFNAHVAQEVTAGQIPQAQADLMKGQFASILDAMIDGAGPVGGKGDRGPGPMGEGSQKPPKGAPGMAPAPSKIN